MLTDRQKGIVNKHLEEMLSDGLSHGHILEAMAENTFAMRDDLRRRYGDCPITDLLEKTAHKIQQLAFNLWE